MRKMIASLAVLAMFALPGVATAQAQGGNSGVDEYTENLPGAGGNKPSSSGGSGDDTSGGPLTPEQATALESEGADGAAAAALAQETGPDTNAGGDGGEGGATAAGGDGSEGGATADGTQSPSSDDDSGVAEVVGDLTSGDDGGMGIALPLILAAALIGAVAFVVARRRGHAGRA